MNVKYLGIISSNKKGNISDVGTYIALRVRVMRNNRLTESEL